MIAETMKFQSDKLAAIKIILGNESEIILFELDGS
jgi:hypothetical protein